MPRKKRQAATSKPDPRPIDHNGITPYLNGFLEWSAAVGLSPRTVDIRQRMLKRFIH